MIEMALNGMLLGKIAMPNRALPTLSGVTGVYVPVICTAIRSVNAALFHPAAGVFGRATGGVEVRPDWSHGNTVTAYPDSCLSSPAISVVVYFWIDGCTTPLGSV